MHKGLIHLPDLGRSRDERQLHDLRRADRARGRVPERPAHPRRLPARRGVAAARLHARDLRHLQGAGAGGGGGPPGLLRFRPAGVRAHRGQGPDLRGHPAVRRHDRGRRRGRGGRDLPPGTRLPRRAGQPGGHRAGHSQADHRARSGDGVQPWPVRLRARPRPGCDPHLLDGQPAQRAAAAWNCRSAGLPAASARMAGSSRPWPRETPSSFPVPTAGSSCASGAPSR